MAYIHTINFSPKIKSFGDIGINVSDHKNGITGIRADLVGDRYLETGSKDDPRVSRAKSSGVKKRSVEKAISPDVPVPSTDKEIKTLLSVSKNKIILENTV